MASEIFKLNVNPDLKTRFTLNPAAHLTEVETKHYRSGRMIRSALSTRYQDAFIFLAGAFHGPFCEEEGGQAGVLDFVIPHYFLYYLMLAWQRVRAPFLIYLPIYLLLGIIDIAVSIVQKIVAVCLYLISLTFIWIVDQVYNKKYLEKKPLILEELMVTYNIDNNDLFPLQEIINPETEDSFSDDNLNYNIVEGKVLSYKDIFSNLEAINTTEIISKNENNYIKISGPAKNDFFVKIDPENPEPLQTALQLNIFGITRSLEKDYSQGVAALERVENFMMPQR